MAPYSTDEEERAIWRARQFIASAVVGPFVGLIYIWLRVAGGS